MVRNSEFLLITRLQKLRNKGCSLFFLRDPAFHKRELDACSEIEIDLAAIHLD